MRYNVLPRCGVTVPELTLGTMMFGGQTDEAESLRIMDYAFDHGVNFFDTANIYNFGESEKIVGKGLKGRRDKVLLATKVGSPMGDLPQQKGLSRRAILSAVEDSLRRLDTDYIDFYYLHTPDYLTDIEDTLETMTTLVRGGKVRYVAVSNYAAWQCADILAACDKRGFIAPVLTQNVYNLLTRGIEGEFVPFLDAHDFGMVVYNPIAAGLLAGKHKKGKPAENSRFTMNPMYYNRYWSEANLDAVEQLTDIAAEAGLSILQLAMRWCAQRACVHSVITGVSRLEQLEQNIASVEGEALGEEILAKCDLIWKKLAGSTFQYNR